MAGDWTRMREGLRDAPEVVGIAARLQMDPDTVVGKLHAVWTWAGKHTTNGLIKRTTAAHVDSAARHAGFAQAMRDECWLEINDNESIRFPRWGKYNSKGSKERALAAERQRRKRERDKRDGKRDARNAVTGLRAEQSRAEQAAEQEEKELKPDAGKAGDSSAGLIRFAAGSQAALLDTEVVAILRRFWKQTPEKAMALAAHPNATYERVCWLADRIIREKPKRPAGFMKAGIEDGYEIDPAWLERFQRATA